MIEGKEDRIFWRLPWWLILPTLVVVIWLGVQIVRNVSDSLGGIADLTWSAVTRQPASPAENSASTPPPR
jgi:hypothetical protein